MSTKDGHDWYAIGDAGDVSDSTIYRCRTCGIHCTTNRTPGGPEYPACKVKEPPKKPKTRFDHDDVIEEPPTLRSKSEVAEAAWRKAASYLHADVETRLSEEAVPEEERRVLEHIQGSVLPSILRRADIIQRNRRR